MQPTNTEGVFWTRDFSMTLISVVEMPNRGFLPRWFTLRQALVLICFDHEKSRSPFPGGLCL